MNMDINELVLKMTYAASQVAQSTLPQTQNQPQKEDNQSFQSLLEEKQTARNNRQPAAEQQPAANGTAPVTDGAVLQQMAALLSQAGQVNVGQPVAETVDANAMAVQTVEAVVAQPVTTESVPVETVLPQQQEAVPELVQEAVPEQTQTVELPVQSDRQTATAPVTEQPEPSAAPVESAVQPQSQSQEAPEQLEVTVENGDGAPQQKQETDETAVQTDGVAQPLFENVKTMPQRVGDAPVVDTERADLDQQLTGKMTEALSEGSRRVEVQLTPEHLGRVVVEMQQDADGVLQVVLHTETAEAARLLSQHSDALGLMLQGSQHTEVRVEVQQPQQDQPSQQQNDQNGGQNQGQQRQQEQRRQQNDPERFLQQLRLGLLSM